MTTCTWLHVLHGTSAGSGRLRRLLRGEELIVRDCGRDQSSRRTKRCNECIDILLIDILVASPNHHDRSVPRLSIFPDRELHTHTSGRFRVQLLRERPLSPVQFENKRNIRRRENPDIEERSRLASSSAQRTYVTAAPDRSPVLRRPVPEEPRDARAHDVILCLMRCTHPNVASLSRSRITRELSVRDTSALTVATLSAHCVTASGTAR